jgi:outer membrane protein assembly factor BamB
MSRRLLRTVRAGAGVFIFAVLTIVAGAANRTQTPPLPLGALVFGVFTAEFRSDGTLTIEGSVEGLGAVRLTGHVTPQSDVIEIASESMKAFELVGGSKAGCDVPGRYRYLVLDRQVRLEAVTDACGPRRSFVDGSTWRHLGTALPARRISRTAERPAPALPRAADPTGSWPSFRGPLAAGVADGQHLPDRWNGETGEHVLWRTPIAGLAHSSPIVWGDRVFVTSAISSRGHETFATGRAGGGGPDDRSSHRWMMYALDRRTGKMLWEREAHQGEPIDKRHPKSTYASSTPVTDGRVVVSWFGSQGVYAFTAAGDFLWRVDLGRVNLGAAGIPTIEWGPASSPIIWNDLVILQADTQDDSLLVALARDTGELVWKTNREEPPSWSTPTVMSTASGAELVTNGTKYVRGYDPRTGEERWRLRTGFNVSMTIPTPVLAEGLYVIASGGLGSTRPIFVVRPGARGEVTLPEGETSNASVVWSRTGRGPFTPTPLAYGGLVYMLGDNGVLDVYDAKTGAEIYRQRLSEIGTGFSASPVAADGKIYLANEDGQMIVAAAGREFRHIATNPMGEPMMATPALSRGVMYARGPRSVLAIGNEAAK